MSYNPEFTEFTLDVDPEATWSDGQPYTADDVVLLVDLLKENANYTGSAADAGLRRQRRPRTDPRRSSSHSEANPRFHYYFTVGIVGEPIRIVPKHIWETQDAGTFTNNPPVYTGPYMLEPGHPDQFMQVWKKNPNYWNKANFDPEPGVRHLSAAPDARRRGPGVRARQRRYPGDSPLPEHAGGPGQLSQLDRVRLRRSLPARHLAQPGLAERSVPDGRGAAGDLAICSIAIPIATTIWQPASMPAEYPWADWGIHDRWTNADIRASTRSTSTRRAGELLDGIGATLSGDRRQMNGAGHQADLHHPGGRSAIRSTRSRTLLADAREKVGIDIEVKRCSARRYPDAYQLGEYDITSHWLCGAALDPGQLYTKFLTRRLQAGRGACDSRPQRDADADPEAERRRRAAQNRSTRTTRRTRPLFDQGLEAYLKNLPAMPSIQTIYPFAFGRSTGQAGRRTKQVQHRRQLVGAVHLRHRQIQPTAERK